MAEPRALSRCWEVGGWTPAAGFPASSPASATTRRTHTVRATTTDLAGGGGGGVLNIPHRGSIPFLSLYFFSPSKSANATQSQTHQWDCTAISPTLFRPDRMLTARKLSGLLFVSPQSSPLYSLHLLSSLPSSSGSIW